MSFVFKRGATKGESQPLLKSPIVAKKAANAKEIRTTGRYVLYFFILFILFLFEKRGKIKEKDCFKERKT